RGAGDASHTPPFPKALVEEMLRAFGRAARAHQLYLHNNPIYLKAVDTARAAFAAIWAHVDEFVLSVTETELIWEGAVVQSETEKAADSLPWLLFKDGIRELRFLRGFEQDELVALLDLLRRARVAQPDEDDLLTMLWEQDFGSLRYQYVDLAVDNVAPVDSVASEERPQRVPPPAEEEEEQPERAGIVNIDDFDSTLYFLDETEIEYLRTEVDKEYASDLRRNVLTVLLDIFEQQRASAVREEIAGTLESLIVTLLSSGQLRTVAFMLREVGVTAERAPELDAATKARLLSLPERLSQPSALGQLLQTLEEAAELPPQDALGELFDQLRPAALGTVLAWIGRTQNARVRALLEAAAARLAASNTAELVRLIGVSDRAVAAEAIRRAGALKSPAAVAPLSKVLAEGDAGLRLSAALALGEIGTPGAMQWLERAVEDPDRDVRVATARLLAQRMHRQGLPRIEAAVKGRTVRDADLTEKVAFFEAYGALCGEGGVPVLDAILHARGFLGKREDGELRACAAMALGRIRSAAATASLQKAAADKDVVVRNAVNKALRGGTA
ncbi:MAG TPA: HEAT repeat domain-containing protein, partial [Gemmatimonadaceae bacterium]|nr:HEAT repeat domain-containing protein [Gemmatimonadaceae bacterium]